MVYLLQLYHFIVVLVVLVQLYTLHIFAPGRRFPRLAEKAGYDEETRCYTGCDSCLL